MYIPTESLKCVGPAQYTFNDVPLSQLDDKTCNLISGAVCMFTRSEQRKTVSRLWSYVKIALLFVSELVFLLPIHIYKYSESVRSITQCGIFCVQTLLQVDRKKLKNCDFMFEPQSFKRYFQMLSNTFFLNVFYLFTLAY